MNSIQLMDFVYSEMITFIRKIVSEQHMGQLHTLNRHLLTLCHPISVTVLNAPVSNLHVVGIYRSKSKVNLHKLIEALNHLYITLLVDKPTIIPGDFNIDLFKPSSERKTLMQNMIECRGYSQLISQFTTDNRTCIDHIYTNIPHLVHSAGVLESYFSDHKPIFVCLQLMH